MVSLAMLQDNFNKASFARDNNMAVIDEMNRHRDSIKYLESRGLMEQSDADRVKSRISKDLNELMHERSIIIDQHSKALKDLNLYKQTILKEQQQQFKARAEKIMNRLSKTDRAFLAANTHLFK